MSENKKSAGESFAGNVMKYSVATYLGFAITGLALIVKGLLPAEVLGKAKVRVRISPSSDVIATWNPGIDGYALGQTHRNLRIARTYPFDIANGVYVEDLSIQYK
mgnify:CR=1 FL=1